MVRSRRMTQALAKNVPHDDELLPEDLGTVTKDTAPQIALTLVEDQEMRQKDVARLLGWSESTISRWINEEKEKREIREREQAERKNRQHALIRDTALVIITLCFVMLTAAVWVIATR